MNRILVQLSVKEASEISKIPVNTLRAHVHRCIIPFRKVKG
jgi:DNA-directed RNA polymerase specialized sigma24 family protein